MSATPIDKQIKDTVDNSIKEAIASFKANESEAWQRTTRMAALTMDNVIEGMAPYVTSCLTASLKLLIPPMYDQLTKISEAFNINKYEQKVNTDRVETYIRQDNIILIGHEEPNSNYTTYGRESTDELENILIDVGNKVGVTIDRNHISDAFRLGKRPVNSDGSPKTRRDGITKVCRPILFKILKRSTRTNLLQKKKTLKDNHGIKIGEDVTPMRKALCDVANEMSSVKVAYPQGGCIAVRTISEPTKIIWMESYKDLCKIPDFSGVFDWEKLKLKDVRT